MQAASHNRPGNDCPSPKPLFFLDKLGVCFSATLVLGTKVGHSVLLIQDFLARRTMNESEELDWLRQLLDGDALVVGEFWRDYGERLQRLAENHLSARLKRRVGADDIVQSVCRTFFRRAQIGQFELADSDALWRLMCAITLTKIRQSARFHGRQKRNLRQEQGVESPGDESAFTLREFVHAGPTPDEAAVFVDELEQLMAGLDDEEQKIVELKLQQFTNEEVAEQIGCSERTVRRMIKRIQSRLRDILHDSSLPP